LIKSFGLRNTQEIDLSGNWRLDTTASDFGEIPTKDAAPLYLEIDQDSNTINFSRVFDGANSVESLKSDGSAVEQQLDGASVKRILTKSLDGSIVTVFSDYNVVPKEGLPFHFNREEIYTLTSSDNNLLLTRITTIADKIDVVKALYKK